MIWMLVDSKLFLVDNEVIDTITLIHINQYNTDKQNSQKTIGDADKKTPDTSGLVTTAVLNTKIIEAENKIPDTSSLVTVFDTKISEVQNKISNHDNYVTSPEFNK